MTYPKATNVSTEIGRMYEWETGGTPANPVYAVTHSFTGRMPINFYHKKVKGRYVSGGDWYMWRQRFKRGGTDFTTYRPLWGRAYSGMYLLEQVAGPGLHPSDWNSAARQASRITALQNRGAEAWNRLRPDLPDFSLATSVMELKDFVPGLKEALYDIVKKVRVEKAKRRGRRKPKRKTYGNRSGMSKTAEYYLAFQFGYLPVMRDIQNFVNAQQNKQKRLAQLIRDEGRPVRRKAFLRDDAAGSDTTNIHKAGYPTDGSLYVVDMIPTHVTQCYASGRKNGVTTTHKQKTLCWAEGRFRYLLPPGPRNVAWTRKMLRRIMGGRITPADLYNIVPWSWLADYFTGLGDFIQAIGPGVGDRLICDYAYLMRTIEYSYYSESQQGLVYSLEIKGKYTTTTTDASRLVKIRCMASPFGWGFKQNSLSPKQISILGALGMSKLP